MENQDLIEDELHNSDEEDEWEEQSDAISIDNEPDPVKPTNKDLPPKEDSSQPQEDSSSVDIDKTNIVSPVIIKDPSDVAQLITHMEMLFQRIKASYKDYSGLYEKIKDISSKANHINTTSQSYLQQIKDHNIKGEIAAEKLTELFDTLEEQFNNRVLKNINFKPLADDLQRQIEEIINQIPVNSLNQSIEATEQGVISIKKNLHELSSEIKSFREISITLRESLKSYIDNLKSIIPKQTTKQSYTYIAISFFATSAITMVATYYFVSEQLKKDFELNQNLQSEQQIVQTQPFHKEYKKYFSKIDDKIYFRFNKYTEYKEIENHYYIPLKKDEK